MTYSILHHIYMNDRDHALDDILQVYREKWSCIVHFLYFANMMHQRLLEWTPQLAQKKYLDALYWWDFLCADGIALQLFYRYSAFGKRKYQPYNLNGTDLIPYLFEKLSQQYSVSVYVYQCYDPDHGKTLAVANHWISELQRKFPAISIPWSNTCLYTKRGEEFDRDWLDEVLKWDSADIKIFFNCTGTPFQEVWAHEHEAKLREHWFLVLSAWWTIDFISGYETRAPAWVVKARIFETFWRIVSKPHKNLKKFVRMFGIVRYRWFRLKQYIFY